MSEKHALVWTTVKEDLKIEDESQFQILETRHRDRPGIQAMLKENNSQPFKDAFWDGRLFGNTFLEEGGSDTIRAGVAHFGVGVSLAPIDIEFSTWTSKSGVEADKDRGMAPMAFRVVKHGLYAVPFFVNPNLAHKTGCTKQDVDLMLHLVKHIYTGTRSVVRSMVEVVHTRSPTRAAQVQFLTSRSLTPSRPRDSKGLLSCWRITVHFRRGRKSKTSPSAPTTR